MEIDLSRRILEFLLHQTSVDNQTLNNPVRVLPIPDNNPKLKNIVDAVQTVSPSANEPPKTRVLPSYKPVTPPCPRRSSHGSHRGAKIVDPMETHTYDTISTPEVTKLQENLRPSSFETVDMEASGPSKFQKGKSVEANQKEKSKPSIMERNSTARTVERSDSIDTEGSPNRPHLSSSKKRSASSFNVFEMAKLMKQRKKKKWTVFEENTLRTGVQKYGKGNWKLILHMYRDTFGDRTGVDLKDKWRNMARYKMM